MTDPQKIPGSGVIVLPNEPMPQALFVAMQHATEAPKKNAPSVGGVPANRVRIPTVRPSDYVETRNESGDLTGFGTARNWTIVPALSLHNLGMLLGEFDAEEDTLP